MSDAQALADLERAKAALAESKLNCSEKEFWSRFESLKARAYAGDTAAANAAADMMMEVGLSYLDFATFIRADAAARAAPPTSRWPTKNSWRGQQW